jgi:hypothetical protein
MRTVAALLSCTLLGAAVANAQTKPGTEIGTTLGVTILSQYGYSTTYIGTPIMFSSFAGGLSTPVQPSIYATIFVSPTVSIEPQLAFARVSTNGYARTSVDVAAQFAYWFASERKESPYLAANLAYQGAFAAYSTAATAPGLGGEIGYRIKVGTGFAIRFTARYRWWFGNNHFNEFGIGMGLGGLMH